MKTSISNNVWGQIDITLVRIASYERPPVWTAELAHWPSQPPVIFSAYAEGELADGAVERAAINAINQWQQQNAVD